MEASVKQGGQIYISHEDNGLIVSNASNVDKPKQLLLMPCFAMDKVPIDLQSVCASIVDPHNFNIFIWSWRGGFLEPDVHYDARDQQTFDKNASFYVRYNANFPGYYSMESVSMPRHFVRVGRNKMKVDSMQETDDFRNAASLAFHDHSTWRTSAHFFQIEK